MDGLAYLTSFFMVSFALFLVTSNQPVRSVLCLIGCFLCATIHWLLLSAEFLALALIFVYVGAVMTLFLFMVMMLNVDTYPSHQRVSYLSSALLVLFSVIIPSIASYRWYVQDNQAWNTLTMPVYEMGYDNTKAIGLVLYTEYFLPFQMIGVLLLVAILVAVAWVHRQKRDFVRSQQISQQMQVNKASRLRLVDK